jgi:hypothetical protein
VEVDNIEMRLIVIDEVEGVSDLHGWDVDGTHEHVYGID